MSARFRDLPAQLREKIDYTPRACWIWTGALTHDGYAKVRWSNEFWLGSRLVYSLAYDVAIDDTTVLRHRCREPMCVNPQHMIATTVRDNTLSGKGPTAVNYAKTHCDHGHLLEGDNVFEEIRKGGGVSRKCRTCWKDRQQARKRSQQSAAKTAKPKPSSAVLLRESREHPATSLALKYGVSDTTIRNWVRAAKRKKTVPSKESS